MKKSSDLLWPEKLAHWVRWLLFNAILCVLAWFAVIQGIAGAARLLSVWLWLFAVVLVSATLSKTQKKAARSVQRVVPAGLNRSVDLSVFVFLVWHGWWVTAIAAGLYLISAIYLYDLREESE